MTANGLPATDIEDRRLPELDGLRGVAILLVVWLHTHLVLPAMVVGVDAKVLAGGQGGPGDRFYAHIASAGWAGVDVFFVLSGYLITGILLRSRGQPHYLKNFFARRALRILPLYYGVVLVTMLVCPPGDFAPWEKVAYLTYWPNLWQMQPGEFMGHHGNLLITWSLAIEEQFYLVWPFLVLWLDRRWLVRVAVGTLLFALALRLWLVAADAYWCIPYKLTPCRVDALMFGALLVLLQLRSKKIAYLAIATGLGGMLVIDQLQGSCQLYDRNKLTLTWGLSLAGLTASGLLLLAGHGGWFAAFLRQRWLRTFGKYSYAIYLLHTPMIPVLVPWFFGSKPTVPLSAVANATGMIWTSSLLFVAISSACFLAAAMVSWNLFERHFLALKRYFPSGRKVPLAPPSGPGS